MDISQNQKKREKIADKKGGEEQEQEEKNGQSTKQQSPTTTTTTSPPSASSSPSHEFSFAVSLHPSSTVPDKTKSPPSMSPPSIAIDLSPADDIFFHGHLLPLHLLSHLPISPRSSTNSLDSFTLPVKDLLEGRKPNNNIISNNTSSSSSDNNHSNTSGTKVRSKPKSFSLFGFAKWRKGCEIGEIVEEEEKKQRKMGFNVSQILRRYIRMVRPILLFRGRRRENPQLRKQPHSFSGNLSFRRNQEWMERRPEYSAPASLWTSPTNSGLLSTASVPSSTSDSTMEELQSAIQAAIAHCKNSIAMKEEKLKC